MAKLTLEDFLNDPAHKEKRDFIGGIIDARIKQLIKQRKKQKDVAEDENKNRGVSGNVFDELFGDGDDDE